MIYHLEKNQRIQDFCSPNSLTIVKFSTTTCKPCQMLIPIFEKISIMEKYKDIIFISVDAREHVQAREYEIRSVPTILYFMNDTLILSEIGIQPEQYFIDLIDKILISNKN